MPGWAQPTLRGTTGFPSSASLRATIPRRDTRSELRRKFGEEAFEPPSRDSRPPSARGGKQAVPRHQAAQPAQGTPTPSLSRSPSAASPPEPKGAAQPKPVMNKKDALIAARRHLDIALLARHRKRSVPGGPGATPSGVGVLGGRPASPPKTRPNSPGRRHPPMATPKGASQRGRQSAAPSREAHSALRRERPAGDAEVSSRAGAVSPARRRPQDTDRCTDERNMSGDQRFVEKTRTGSEDEEGSSSSSARHHAALLEQVRDVTTDDELAEKTAVIEALQRQLEELRSELHQPNSTPGQASQTDPELQARELHAELQHSGNASIAPDELLAASLPLEMCTDESGMEKQRAFRPPRPLIPKLPLGDHLETAGIAAPPMAHHHHPWALASEEAQLRSLEHSASECHLRGADSGYDAAMVPGGGMYHFRPPGSETSSEDCWSTSHVDPETLSLVSSVNPAG